ncbi:MAG: ImmA/IrrE family metallo-endopeptidase [Alphaproteobacteria bacterium]|nr:ImmA/IrrE family metallo-endopeptidase [Alphaproteobacteria bacterium]MBF0394234.1 ImmA/IrrE family metallo-endopeptidase [Alphaproteobacteria bacterium]
MGTVTFDLRIQWSRPDPAGNAFEATEGHADLRVGEKEVWAGVHWHWVDLLAFLAENWVFLKMEQTYPAGLKPRMPHLLRHAAVERWELEKRSGLITDNRIEAEEEDVFGFECRHDLACALEGKWAPSAFMLREGNHMLISGDGFLGREKYSSVMTMLKELGDEIAGRLRQIDNVVARLRVAEWDQRERRPFSLELASLVTGAPINFLDEISGDRGAGISLNDNNPEIRDTVFMAAARMAYGASLSSRSAAAILSIVAKSPKSVSGDLRVLWQDAQDQMNALPVGLSAAEEGHLLAEWARNRILPQHREEAPPNLDALVDGWMVPVCGLGLSHDGVDAMLCWGDGHGPVVIINSTSARNRKSSGHRAALAHEICHLLFDLENSLPFAEVISGESDDWTEKRARAFAAELLFPRKLCERYFKDTTLASFIGEMTLKFDISSEIAAWQLYRSTLGTKLTNIQKGELKKFVSNPDGID